MVSMFVGLVIPIVIIGLICWALVYFIPMPPKLVTAIYVIAGLCVLVSLLRYFGVWPGDLSGPPSAHRRL